MPWRREAELTPPNKLVRNTLVFDDISPADGRSTATLAGYRERLRVFLGHFETFVVAERFHSK